MNSKKYLVVHTDGGSRGNPGLSAIGFIIEEQGKTVYSYGKPIGIGTNNQAEYEAVAESLRWIVKKFHEKGEIVNISFFLDSLLVVQQLKGLFKIKHPDLRSRANVIHTLIQKTGGEVTFAHVPRSENSFADSLVNIALDTGKEIVQN
jgi:ribonuclease HI